MTYPTYPTEIWDYLQDIPYMPSKSDREYILQKQDHKRLMIWEYFFRIKPDDIGQPQKTEIQEIEQTLSQEIHGFNHQVHKDREYASLVRTETLKEILKYSLSLILSVLLWKLFVRYLYSYDSPFSMFDCLSPFLVFDFVVLIGIVIAKSKEITLSRTILSDQSKRRLTLGKKVAEGHKRIIFLQSEIEVLKKKIPQPYSDEIIKKWLDEELFELWQFSKEKTGLGTRLIPIGFYETPEISKSVSNPLAIMGPGELQDSKNMHPLFKKNLSVDYNKHLTARRAYKVRGSDKKDVIYGVYFIEYIGIADDMLATFGFFYDFIARERYSEKVTEQYYKDVVSISTANEFREIRLNDSDESIRIEDAPTLTLSLSSGEARKVTFVNDTYFWRIKEKLDMTDNEAKNMNLVQISAEMAENATKALRYHLRKHKGNLETEFNNS